MAAFVFDDLKSTVPTVPFLGTTVRAMSCVPPGISAYEDALKVAVQEGVGGTVGGAVGGVVGPVGFGVGVLTVPPAQQEYVLSDEVSEHAPVEDCIEHSL